MAAVTSNTVASDTLSVDTNLIYSRVIGLQASGLDVDVEDVFAHELSPVPTSMFTDEGKMRVAKSKSTLKQSLKVDSSSTDHREEASTTIIDGAALLWVVAWPSNGTVKDYINNFVRHILPSKS